MPLVESYELPVDAMQEVAASSGLQWVATDAAKVAAAQAAAAAEPAPIRVPRERAPAPKQDDAPLVMVETHRDLRELPLPFDQKP